MVTTAETPRPPLPGSQEEPVRGCPMPTAPDVYRHSVASWMTTQGDSRLSQWLAQRQSRQRQCLAQAPQSHLSGPWSFVSP